jgi:ssDNA-binding Zn-finger/Zn-ribbon topoisomerase 1
VLRQGRHGHFYGCSKYPACKGIVKDDDSAEGTAKTRQKPTAGPRR